MPGYKGGALRLFRGASAGERRRAVYGVSWTSNLSAAEDFAESYRVFPGGSVVLETVAQSEAIISAVEYPSPVGQTSEIQAPKLGAAPAATRRRASLRSQSRYGWAAP
jgi:hypothetical protein